MQGERLALTLHGMPVGTCKGGKKDCSSALQFQNSGDQVDQMHTCVFMSYNMLIQSTGQGQYPPDPLSTTFLEISHIGAVTHSSE